MNHVTSDVDAPASGHPGYEAPTELSMREWLDLGQEMTERCRTFISPDPKWFRAWHTQMFSIGRGLSVKADGKKYGPGRYVLGPRA